MNRVLKENATCVVFGAQPFSSELILSNKKNFRLQWIWDKTIAANFLNAKHHPLKIHEDINVFSNGKLKYNPQKTKLETARRSKGGGIAFAKSETFKCKINTDYYAEEINPKSIIKFSARDEGRWHPTQKPVELLEYLIRTHSDEGATVLDCFAGSGSCAIACINTNRNFIGCERDPGYYAKAIEWIEKHEPEFIRNQTLISLTVENKKHCAIFPFSKKTI